jgi:RimJ/RimL family protein N-acetyltransferase
MPMELETERLVLRPWAESDAGDYRALIAERDNGTVSAETAGERIAAQLATSERTGIGLLAVRRRAEGDFIGYCGLIVGRASARVPPRPRRSRPGRSWRAHLADPHAALIL